MLNKIKLIGKVLPFETKEKEEKRELIIYFSLMVPNPNGSTTVLRCVTQGETAKKLKEELQENDIVEARGYLRNEKNRKKEEKNDWEEREEYEKESKQILTKVLDFKKLDLTFNELIKQVKEEKIDSNQVRLVGKIITKLLIAKKNKKTNAELLTFKIAVPRERNLSPLINNWKNKIDEYIKKNEGKENWEEEIKNYLEAELLKSWNKEKPLFFCRAQGEIITEFNQRLNKDDIILLEGFLQTKKDVGEGKEIERNSAVICQGFTLLDNDSVNIFNPLDKLNHVVKKVKWKDLNSLNREKEDE